MAFEDWFLARVRVSNKEHKRVKLDDKMMFFQQLSTLVSSGTPLLEALRISAGQNQSLRMRQILEEIADRVAAGCSLREVMVDYRDVFEDHWIELVGVGALDEVGSVGRDTERLSRGQLDAHLQQLLPIAPADATCPAGPFVDLGPEDVAELADLADVAVAPTVHHDQPG